MRVFVLMIGVSLCLYIFGCRYLAQQMANPPQQPKAQKRAHSAITPVGAPPTDVEAQIGKRPRGRPKGSKTKKKAPADNMPKEGESIMIP